MGCCDTLCGAHGRVPLLLKIPSSALGLVWNGQRFYAIPRTHNGNEESLGSSL